MLRRTRGLWLFKLAIIAIVILTLILIGHFKQHQWIKVNHESHSADNTNGIIHSNTLKEPEHKITMG